MAEDELSIYSASSLGMSRVVINLFFSAFNMPLCLAFRGRVAGPGIWNLRSLDLGSKTPVSVSFSVSVIGNYMSKTMTFSFPYSVKTNKSGNTVKIFIFTVCPRNKSCPVYAMDVTVKNYLIIKGPIKSLFPIS
jgi:hypothetical protein